MEPPKKNMPDQPHHSPNWQIHFKNRDAEAFKRAFLSILEYRLAKDKYSATAYDRFLAVAYAVAEHLIEQWIVTQQTYHRDKPKRVYYLSMEFLMGRSLENSLINIGMHGVCREALKDLGIDLHEIIENEMDAGLGNGGLGRLAACFLDSLATLGIPAHGYSLRYEFGLFQQRLLNGKQVEIPDHWLALPHPWEIERPEAVFRINFGGHLENGRWVPKQELKAMPFDVPVPGYHTGTVNTLRLWSASANEEFNLEYFNHGDYMRASYEQLMTENITKVLYPNDTFFVGKELRLKQEYLLVSASVQDIVRRFKVDYGTEWNLFPEKTAIQLNDTHPALAIPELMRILIDEEHMDWNRAWEITVPTFGYTNHTILPEALEEWPVSMMTNLLPRHMELIFQINLEFLKEVARRYPGDTDRLRRMSIIAEGEEKRIRMAHLAVAGSHHVNGVAELHTHLLKETILHDFHEMWPERFSNKTNGVTPRRWIKKANPKLSGLISETLRKKWMKDLTMLRDLEKYADDPAFQDKWRAIKAGNKVPLAALIQKEHGFAPNLNSMFDVQAKRIHEYKRQILFALYIIHNYLKIKDNPNGQHVPRTFLFAGKAAPGYHTAKMTIHLINRIAEMINADKSVQDLMRVAFLADYRVSMAEQLIPAADLSEQISTAGKEASGTGNMKFTMNGALTIGTLDGANIEIMQEVGRENIFIFGMEAKEVMELKACGYRPEDFLARSPELQRVFQLLECGFFCPDDPSTFRSLIDDLKYHDPYCVLADFGSYVACQEKVSSVYAKPALWTKMSILNVARSGKFSSDRTIREYARDVWQTPGIEIEDPHIPPSHLRMS